MVDADLNPQVIAQVRDATDLVEVVGDHVKLKSSASPYMYSVKKNKQNTPDRLELKKYDPVVRKHVVFKESR